MTISVITVCRNSAACIKDTIESVLAQTYSDIEYIVVDGQSTDGTIEIIRSYESRFNGRMRWISEPDEGLYDAINKGISMATGDVVGTLNSDDFYSSDDVIANIADAFQDRSIEAVYGDVRFVSATDTEKTVRYYSSHNFRPWRFRFGFMPPHPSFFTYKRNFDTYGYYQTDYRIAADYELLIRFLHTHRLTAKYLSMEVVTMRMGGRSTASLKSNWILNRGIVRGCRGNGIYTNMLLLGLKYFVKIFELIDKRQ
jgi:glycosyltransferase involved in cell wall biosynthesis